MAVPLSFHDLDKASSSPAGTFISVIGVVVDALHPTRTKRGDLMLTCKLLDAAARDSVQTHLGLTVRFFKPNEHELPEVQGPGDVLLLRNMRVNNIRGQSMPVSHSSSDWLVFREKSIPDPAFAIQYQGDQRIPSIGTAHARQKLTIFEQNYIINLKNELKDHVDVIRASAKETEPSSLPENVPSGPRAMQQSMPSALPTRTGAMQYPPLGPHESRKRPGNNSGLPNAQRQKVSTFGWKFKLIQDLRLRVFSDVCGQVVKLFPGRYGDCDLYITDYTSNEEMFYYTPPEEKSKDGYDGDAFGYSSSNVREWPGPYQFLVLKVNMKPPHSQHAIAHFREGDFVFLGNVKMKQAMAHGARLEGDMWVDDKTPDRIHARKLSSRDVLPEIEDILNRKEKYWAARKAEEDSRTVPREEIVKPSKNAQKKASKKEKKAKKQAEAAADAALVPSKHDNKHIRCQNPQVPTTSLAVIQDPGNERQHTQQLSEGRSYTLPFVNYKYRSRVRVVDFAPHSLEDFAIPVTQNAVRSEHGSRDSSPMDIDSSPKYEWSFSLLLEDASSVTKKRTAHSQPSRLWATVSHTEAQYLLGNGIPDPDNLHFNPQLLAMLRQQLCILWGDLDEQKAKQQEVGARGAVPGVSNLGFECCLQEFGMPLVGFEGDAKSDVRGWRRCYRMFGVTIL